MNLSRPAGALAGAAAICMIAVAGSGATPRCFGAAARDPRQPCHDQPLAYSVSPAPADALIEPGLPCTPVRPATIVDACTFGVARRQATATVALVGDSHSAHWRPALAVVARARRRRVLSIYRSQCPFTTAAVGVVGNDGKSCVDWNRRVPSWFSAHPSVHTVFVSGRASTRPHIESGEDGFEAMVAGYQDAWAALPRSVTRIFVLRDVPKNRTGTLACVERAVSSHRRPGPACAVPRSYALQRDPAIVAATRAASPRIRTVDLTRFMCGRSRCFPVVGGALVHKDIGHLTRTFAATLGPFLLRAVEASARARDRGRLG